VAVPVAPLGREFVKADVGSDFDGQKPPRGFFFAICVDESPFVVEVGEAVWDVADIVEVEELFEAIDDDEFDLCMTFLCGINMRDTSSALIELNAPWRLFAPFQPSLGNDWRLGGDATAVVMDVLSRRDVKVGSGASL
jgi:hypothetical protein